MTEWLTAILSTALGKTVAAGAAVVAVGGAAVVVDNLPTFDDTDVVVTQLEENGDPQVDNGDVEPQVENGNDENHGMVVSQFATEGADEAGLEGCEKGQAISLVARGADPDELVGELADNGDLCLTGLERAEHVQENHPGKNQATAASGNAPEHAGQGLERAGQGAANAPGAAPAGGPPTGNGN